MKIISYSVEMNFFYTMMQLVTIVFWQCMKIISYFRGNALLLYYDAIGNLMGILAMHEIISYSVEMHFFYTMMQLVT